MTKFVQGPFTVRWLDGTTEQIDVPEPVWEDDLASLWADHRTRGAVALIDARNTIRSSDYTVAKLTAAGLGPGVSVTHRRYPNLRGRIVGYEYHTNGKLSALPIKVYWDEQDSARDLLGWFWIYPAAESLLPVAPTGESCKGEKK